MTHPVHRDQVEVDGTQLSYLVAGDPGDRPLLLLHGTFWSRVWQPVLPLLGEAAPCLALDLPGFGASGGELDVEHATVPALAQTVLAAADALGLEEFDLAGHDIGGGIAQHVAATSGRVRKLVLMNSVMFDSWPVPAVAWRFPGAVGFCVSVPTVSTTVAWSSTSWTWRDGTGLRRSAIDELAADHQR